MSGVGVGVLGLTLTASVAETADRHPEFVGFVASAVASHFRGDWGDVDDHDRVANDDAAAEGREVISSWRLPDGVTGPDDHVWVVTAAGHESTVVLWPSER